MILHTVINKHVKFDELHLYEELCLQSFVTDRRTDSKMSPQKEGGEGRHHKYKLKM